MSKKTSYFSHDSNARNDEKILAMRMRHGAEGYGVYFMLIERLRDEADYTSVKDYNMIAFDLRVSAEKVKSVVQDFGLFSFTDDGKRFYSESFMERMKLKDEKTKRRSDAGKKGMEKRWNGKKDNNVTKTDSNVITKDKIPITSKVKESKVKNNTPLPPKGEPDGGDVSWKKDIKIYLKELRIAYRKLIEDPEYIRTQEKFHPNVDIKLSLEKACTNFWATDAGWTHKKKKRSKDINWKTTLTNAIDMNKVYKPKDGEVTASKEPYKPDKW
jgi:uncharacterized protein YdaU (DUF1376 family)